MKKLVLCALVLLGMASLCKGATIMIDDFESYPSSLALRAAYPATANVTLTLSTTEYHSGGKSMFYEYNNGAQPLYAKAEHQVAFTPEQADWTGTTELSIWYKCTVPKEPLQLVLVDAWGINVFVGLIGTPAQGDWTQAVIDLTGPDKNGKYLTAAELQRIGRVDIVFTSKYYGAGKIYFDDLARTVVPEPAAMVLLGLGSLGLLRKRK